MQIDYEAWRFWMGIAQLAATVLIGVYVWWSNREKVTNKRFRSLEDRQTASEADMKKLKERVDSRPPCMHHGDFDARLAEVKEGVSNINGRLVGIGNSLDLIQQHLISQGGKK